MMGKEINITLKALFVLEMFKYFGHAGKRKRVCTEESFTPLEVMLTLLMKLPHTEVKFYPEVKSQTGLSSLWDSC